ncbi:hypothetical protein [Desulfoluna spongiiphila]|uniref:Uncharacterized protein n=1 Tax=Desulfoluna spongiiphila TaxID=419481 RepID=A0A1G5GH68_9BACT|nr:hypothetical protein [Desulfoluna spongiiphila]SCY50649.1 hypothetical protein SAMN05216233_110152 [Desulfoluna spongiiphila]
MTQKVLLICLALLLCVFGGAGAADSPSEKELCAAFDHLEESVGTPSGMPEATYLDTLLAFLDNSPAAGTVWEETRKGRGTGVGVAFSVPTSMDRFIQYMYDPDIPVSAVVPGVVRLVRDNGSTPSGKGTYARLAEPEGGRETPIAVRSRYVMEITPDGNSGAYYGYDQNELTLLSSRNGRRFLLTASRQTAPSDVGKKGYPVATRDGGTLYCYSGKTGLTKAGLGWVDSYIYTSIAITVYYEDAPGSGTLKAVSCKWLNAGWMGKNMVRPHHIAEGIERFAQHLGRFLTSPNIPEPQALAGLVRQVRESGDQGLRTVLGNQLEALVAPDQKRASMMDREYVKGLDREELVAGILSTHVESLMAGGDPAFLNGLLGKNVGAKDTSLLTRRIASPVSQIPAGADPALN